MCRNRLCLQLQRFLGRFRSFPSICRDPAPPAPWHPMKMSELRSRMPSISERELEPPMACDILNSELNKADWRQWSAWCVPPVPADAATSCRFRCFPKLPPTNSRSLQERNEGLCLEMRAMDNAALWLKEPPAVQGAVCMAEGAPQVLGQLEKLPKYSCKDFVCISEASMKPELRPKSEPAAPFCLSAPAPSISEAMRKREEKLLESIKRESASHWSQQKERLPSRQFEEDFDNLRRWQKRQSTSRQKARETEEKCSPTSRQQKQRKKLKSKDIPQELRELESMSKGLNLIQLKMILEMRNKSNSKQEEKRLETREKQELTQKNENRVTDSDSGGCEANPCGTFKHAETKVKDAAIQRMLLLSDLKQKRSEIVAKQQLLKEKSRQTQAENKQQLREVKRMVRHRRPSPTQCTTSSHSLMVAPAISKFRKMEVPRGLEDAFGDPFPERLEDSSKLLGKTHPTQPQQSQQPFKPLQIVPQSNRTTATGSTIILRKCLSSLKGNGTNADALVVYWLRQTAFPPDRGTKKEGFIIDETRTSTSMTTTTTLWPSTTKNEKTPSDDGPQ